MYKVSWTPLAEHTIKRLNVTVDEAKKLAIKNQSLPNSSMGQACLKNFNEQINEVGESQRFQSNAKAQIYQKFNVKVLMQDRHSMISNTTRKR